MRNQEIIGLWEAYQQVYAQPEEVEQLDEGRRTSLQALSRESQQRKADKERGRPETESEIHGRLMLGKFRPSASQEERAEGGRQRLKDRGKVPKKGGKDMFEHVLEYLVAEGYADTNKAALAIMTNMSEEWKQSIVEQGYSPIGPVPGTPGGAARNVAIVGPPKKPIDAIPGVRNFRIAAANYRKGSEGALPGETLQRVGRHSGLSRQMNIRTTSGTTIQPTTKFTDKSGDK